MKTLLKYIKIATSITIFHLIPMGITIIWIVLLCMGHFEYFTTYVYICLSVVLTVGLSMLTERRPR